MVAIILIKTIYEETEAFRCLVMLPDSLNYFQELAELQLFQCTNILGVGAFVWDELWTLTPDLK